MLQMPAARQQSCQAGRLLREQTREKELHARTYDCETYRYRRISLPSVAAHLGKLAARAAVIYECLDLRICFARKTAYLERMSNKEGGLTQRDQHLARISQEKSLKRNFQMLGCNHEFNRINRIGYC